MFHAGAVVPSSVFLLQLLTPPGGDLGIPLDVYDALDPPVRAGLIGCSAAGRESGLKVLEPLLALFMLGPLLRPKEGDVKPGLGAGPPVVEGLKGPPRFGPIVTGKLEGVVALATRLNAPRHWRTWAGSLDS